MKKIIIFTIIIVLLSSCTEKQDDSKNSLYKWDNSNLVIKKSPERTPEEVVKIIWTLKTEDKDILLKYYNLWEADEKTKKELLANIKDIIIKREAEIKNLEEKWDNKSIKEIRKDLNIFNMVIRDY